MEREELERKRRDLLEELAGVEAQLAAEKQPVRPDVGDLPRADDVWRSEMSGALEYLCVTDCEGRLLYVNHPQPGTEDCIGKSLFDFIPSKDQPEMRRAWQRYDETGLPQHYELTGTGANGEQATYTAWFYGLVRDGQLVGYVVQSLDVTRQRRVAEDLEVHQGRFESLIAHAPDNILIVDREHRVVFINRTLFDFPEEQLLGATLEDVLRERDRAKVHERIESVFLTGAHTAFEVIVAAAQNDHWFSVRMGPIFRETEVVQVTLIATDITARKRAEASSLDLAAQLHQSQKMEAIGKLTGGVAHDFNNLLTVIIGNLELVDIEDSVPEEALELTHRAKDGARRASALTQRLLAFSRKQALQPRIVDLGELLDGMHVLLHGALGETIELTIIHPDEMHPDEAWLCSLDPAEIENVILNLALNARDAMPEGGALEFKVENVSQSGNLLGMPAGDCLRLTVRDTGYGMSEDVLARVYDPFFTTKDVGQGSGLGLSMVYGFVSQSGGTMRIESREGQGTTVQIFLPRASMDASPAAVERKDGEPRGAGERILVVEDDEDVRELTLKVLKRLGYRTLEASDVVEALEQLDAEDGIQLILTDVVLPGGRSGIDLAREAARLRPELRSILCSGYAQDAASHAGVAPEGLQLLKKPYSRAELARAVRGALEP